MLLQLTILRHQLITVTSFFPFIPLARRTPGYSLVGSLTAQGWISAASYLNGKHDLWALHTIGDSGHLIHISTAIAWDENLSHREEGEL